MGAWSPFVCCDLLALLCVILRLFLFFSFLTDFSFSFILTSIGFVVLDLADAVLLLCFAFAGLRQWFQGGGGEEC